MYNKLYSRIMELETALANNEMLANEAAFCEDAEQVAFCEKTIRGLRRELAIAREEWKNSPETLVYSCV